MSRRIVSLVPSSTETLLALGRTEEALQWFVHSAAADIEGVTDAEDRVGELA